MTFRGDLHSRGVASNDEGAPARRLVVMGDDVDHARVRRRSSDVARARQAPRVLTRQTKLQVAKRWRRILAFVEGKGGEIAAVGEAREQHRLLLRAGVLCDGLDTEIVVHADPQRQRKVDRCKLLEHASTIEMAKPETPVPRLDLHPEQPLLGEGSGQRSR
jgi:hypothetical protein